MPNGKQARVSHIGTVLLGHNFQLQDVLCVPDFQFNLLSASKLTKQLSSYIIFTPAAYMVQDIHKQSSVVLGKEKSGLYYVLKEPYHELQFHKSTSCAIAAHTHRISPFISDVHLSALDLWHFRLGHLSFDTIKRIRLPCNNVKSPSVI